MDKRVKAAIIAGIFGIIVACIELLPWLFSNNSNMTQSNNHPNFAQNRQDVIEKPS